MFHHLVLQEIEDRRGFLDEMEKLGEGKKYRTIIMTEISQVIWHHDTTCKLKNFASTCTWIDIYGHVMLNIIIVLSIIGLMGKRTWCPLINIIGLGLWLSRSNVVLSFSHRKYENLSLLIKKEVKTSILLNKTSDEPHGKKYWFGLEQSTISYDLLLMGYRIGSVL